MEYDKKRSQDDMDRHNDIRNGLRGLIPAETMESFASDDVRRFQLSGSAMLRLLEAMESEPNKAFNLAALGFHPVTGRTINFRNKKSAELSAPKDALVLPVRELRPSEKTRLIAMTSYSTARNALITGISGTFAFKSAMTLEADRFQNLEKSGIAALFMVGTMGVLYLAGKQLVQNIPQVIAATKASELGVAIDVPEKLDMSYPQLARSLSHSYPLVY